MQVTAYTINGQTKYFDDSGKEYSAEEIRQRNTLDSSSGKGLSRRIAEAFTGESDTPTVDDFMSRTPKPVDTSIPQSNYTIFKDTSADDNQKTANAATTFNIPQTQLLMSDKETQKAAVKEAETPKFDPFALANENPKLYERLKDPVQMAVMHDDIQNLQEVESVGTQIANAFELTQKQNRLNEIDYKAMTEGKKFDELDADTQAERRQLIARINSLQKNMPKGFFTVSNFANMAAGMISDFSEAAKYAAAGALAGGVAGSVIPVIGTVAGATSGLTWGGRIGLVKAGAERAAAETYRKNIEKGRSVGDATKGAVVSGIFGGAVNAPFGASILRSRLINTATKTGLLKEIGVNSIEQSFLGAAAGVGTVYGDKVASGNYTWTADDAMTVAGSAATMAAMGTLMSTPGYAWAGLHELGKRVDRTKLKERNPELMKNIVNESVPGDVSLDPDAVYQYVASLESDEAADFLRRINVTPEEFQAHMDTGERIHMDTGTFTQLKEDERQWFYGDLRFNDLPSAKEVQADYEDGPVEIKDENRVKDEVDTESIEREETDYQNARTAEINDEVEGERTYLAANLLEGKPNESQKKDSLEFNLQLFGHKTAKTVSEEYRAGKLTPEAEAEFERIAQKYGYSSGDELAKDILAKRAKEEEKTARVQKMMEDVKRENGTDAEGVAARAELNDENLTRMEQEGEAMRKASNLEDMDAKEDTTADTMMENLDAMESLLDLDEYMNHANRNPTLRERIAAMKKEINAKWKERMTNLREQRDETVSKLKETYKEKLDAQKEKAKERVQAQKEKDKARLEKKQGEWKATVDAYNTLLNDVREQTKDTRARRAARMGTVKVTEAKARGREILAQMKITEARDFRRLFQMAKREEAIAERFYRKGVKPYRSTLRQARQENARPEEFDTAGEEGFTIDEDISTATPWSEASASRATYLEQAMHHKNRAILLQAMAKDAIRINAEVNRMNRYISKTQSQLNKDWSKALKGKPTISKNAIVYNQLLNLLDRFGIPAKAERVPLEDVTLSKFADDMAAATGAERIPDWIKNSTDKVNFGDLNLEDARDVVNAIKNIRAMARDVDRMVSDDKKKSVSDMMREMNDELADNPNHYQMKDENPGSVKSTSLRLIHDQANMDTVIHILCPDSKVIRGFWIDRKQKLDGLEGNDVREYMQKMKAIWDRYTNAERRRNQNKEIYLSHLQMNATKRQLLAIAMNLGTEGNREKLFRNRPIDLEGANWNEANVMADLMENLDERDWETVQMTWDLIGTLKEKIIEHEERVTGFPPKMVEASGFDVRVGGKVIHMNGGYFPLVKDIRLANRDAGMEDANTLTMMKNPSGAAATSHGFTKERTNAQYAISLDPKIATNHILDVLHDYYFRDYVSDMNKLLNKDGAFYQMLYEKGGPQAVEDFRNCVLQTAGMPDKRDVGEYGVNSIFAWMKKSTAFSSIAFNIGVITQNFANLVLYPGAVKGFGVTDALYGILRYGLFDYWGKSLMNWRGEADWLAKNLSPYMATQYERPDYAFRSLERNDASAGIGRLGQLSDAVTKFSGALMWYTDSLVSVPMWKTAYQKKLRETGNREEAMQYADTLIRRVNGSNNRADVSRFMQAKSSSAYGMLNTFMGFFNTEANRWMREIYDVTGRDLKTNIRNLPHFLGYAAARMFVFTLASNILMLKFPDEENGEDWGTFILKEGLKEPFQNFPIIRDLIPNLIDRAFTGESYSYRPPMAFSLPAQALVAGGNVINYLNNDDPSKEDAKFESAAESVTKLLAYVTRMPMILNNIFWNAYDYDQNNITEWQAGDYIRRRPREDRN